MFCSSAWVTRRLRTSSARCRIAHVSRVPRWACSGGGEGVFSQVPSLAARQQALSTVCHFCMQEKCGTLIVFQLYGEWHSKHFLFRLSLKSAGRLCLVINVNCGASFQTCKEMLIPMSGNSKESFPNPLVACQYLRANLWGGGSPYGATEGSSPTMLLCQAARK